MEVDIGDYTLPRWRLIRWLTDVGKDAPTDIRVALIASLFGTLPVFVGGVVNTLAVCVAIAIRSPTLPFLAWLVLESAICATRIAVLVKASRAVRTGQETPTDIYLLLSLCWAASVGYGSFVSLISGDWVIATLACASATAMAGGICFRNFGAPRLVAAMILLSIGPIGVGGFLSGQPLLLIVLLQIPLYFITMSLAAFRLNALLISTMQAERENAYRARHDALTGLSNRFGLVGEFEMRRKTVRNGRMALLYLDLDGFKAVNDQFGHAAGDQLLKMVADRLSRQVSGRDIAARFGGDEFVVLADGMGEAEALDLGERLSKAIATTYDIADGMSVAIGVSIGIAVTPQHGQDVPTLLASADVALYDAKANGKGRCAVASVEANLAKLAQLETQARRQTQFAEAG